MRKNEDSILKKHKITEIPIQPRVSIAIKGKGISLTIKTNS